MKNHSAKDVASYIALSDIEARSKLKEIQEIIKSTIPNVEETISWGVPFYKYHGALAGFALYKEHVSFGMATALQKKDRKILEKLGYKTGKKTITNQI
jgi:uncharacterized protein YdhG (YjbR/CyaY superfamily)